MRTLAARALARMIRQFGACDYNTSEFVLDVGPLSAATVIQESTEYVVVWIFGRMSIWAHPL